MTNVTSNNAENEVKPPTPRWVKVFAIVIGLFVVVVVILHLTGNGPGSHGR
jgi:hypothetical protein